MARRGELGAAPSPGLARLRAQPGAEAVRQAVVRDQQAAKAAETAAVHHQVHSVLPVRKGSRVQHGNGDRAVVVLTDVSVEWDGRVHHGHVVRWANIARHEWVLASALTVLP